jgi:hypothetical protein
MAPRTPRLPPGLDRFASHGGGKACDRNSRGAATRSGPWTGAGSSRPYERIERLAATAPDDHRLAFGAGCPCPDPFDPGTFLADVITFVPPPPAHGPLIGPFPDPVPPGNTARHRVRLPKPGGERVLNRWAGQQEASRPISTPLAPFLPWLVTLIPKRGPRVPASLGSTASTSPDSSAAAQAAA